MGSRPPAPAGDRMPPQVVRSNERMNFMQLIWATPYWIIFQQYIPVLITRLGASALMLGILNSGAALMLMLGTGVGRWWLQHAPRDMRKMILPVMGARSIVLWVPLVLLLPAHRPELLVLVTVVTNLFLGVVQVCFLTILPRMTWPERISIMVSGRWTVLGIGMSLGIPLLAAVLDAFPPPLNYVIACGFAIITSVAETLTYLRWKPAPQPETPGPAKSARADLAIIWRHAPSRRYLFLTLQIVRQLHASNVEYGWYSAISWLTIAITGVIRPRLIQRFGNGTLYALGALGLGLEALTLGVAQSLPATWLAGAIGGLSMGIFQVTAFGLIVDSAPPDCYDSFVSVQASVGNFAVFASPLLTTGLLSLGMPLGSTLLLCAVARAAAGLMAYVGLRKRDRPGVFAGTAPRPARIPKG